MLRAKVVVLVSMIILVIVPPVLADLIYYNHIDTGGFLTREEDVPQGQTFTTAPDSDRITTLGLWCEKTAAAADLIMVFYEVSGDPDSSPLTLGDEIATVTLAAAGVPSGGGRHWEMIGMDVNVDPSSAYYVEFTSPGSVGGHGWNTNRAFSNIVSGGRWWWNRIVLGQDDMTMELYDSKGTPLHAPIYSNSDAPLGFLTREEDVPQGQTFTTAPDSDKLTALMLWCEKTADAADLIMVFYDVTGDPESSPLALGDEIATVTLSHDAVPGGGGRRWVMIPLDVDVEPSSPYYVEWTSPGSVGGHGWNTNRANYNVEDGGRWWWNRSILGPDDMTMELYDSKGTPIYSNSDDPLGFLTREEDVPQGQTFTTASDTDKLTGLRLWCEKTADAADLILEFYEMTADPESSPLTLGPLIGTITLAAADVVSGGGRHWEMISLGLLDVNPSSPYYVEFTSPGSTGGHGWNTNRANYNVVDGGRWWWNRSILGIDDMTMELYDKKGPGVPTRVEDWQLYGY